MTSELKQAEATARVYDFDFALWWSALCKIAKRADFPLDVERPSSYKEYFDDGDSPRDALDAEIEAAQA